MRLGCLAYRTVPEGVWYPFGLPWYPYDFDTAKRSCIAVNVEPDWNRQSDVTASLEHNLPAIPAGFVE